MGVNFGDLGPAGVVGASNTMPLDPKPDRSTDYTVRQCGNGSVNSVV